MRPPGQTMGPAAGLGSRLSPRPGRGRAHRPSALLEQDRSRGVGASPRPLPMGRLGEDPLQGGQVLRLCQEVSNPSFSARRRSSGCTQPLHATRRTSERPAARRSARPTARPSTEELPSRTGRSPAGSPAPWPARRSRRAQTSPASTSRGAGASPRRLAGRQTAPVRGRGSGRAGAGRLEFTARPDGQTVARRRPAAAGATRFGCARAELRERDGTWTTRIIRDPTFELLER
jgi:hypothetical protein